MTQPVLTPGRARRKSLRRQSVEATLIAGLFATGVTALVVFASTTPAWAAGSCGRCSSCWCGWR